MTEAMAAARHPGPAIVVGLGEVLWDVYDQAACCGGAPANFACHAAALGAEAHVVSAVGDDPLGQQALSLLRERGVNVDPVARVPEAPTGSVRVSLDASGLPQYRIQRDVAWDLITWTAAMEELAGRADAVCFGTVAQRQPASRRTIQRFLDATGPHCLRLCDVNLRQGYFDRDVVEQSLRRSTVVKVNGDELAVLAELLGFDATASEAGLGHLVERFDLRLAILTLGARGALLREPTQTVTVAAEPVQVVDTVGAGDAFAATMAVGLLAGCPLRALAQHACRVAGHVCAHQGAVPALPAALRTLPTA